MRFALADGNLEVSINGAFSKTLLVLRIDQTGQVADQDGRRGVVSCLRVFGGGFPKEIQSSSTFKCDFPY